MMTKTTYLAVTVLTGLLLFFGTVSCTPPVESGTTVTVFGTVTNQKTGAPVAGAVVSAGGSSATTGADGSYSITLSGGFDGKVLNIRMNGFARFSKPLGENEGDEAKLDAALVPVDFIALIDPSETVNVVETLDGARVDFPDLSGQGFANKLRVSMTHFDVSSDELASVPGNFMGSDGGVTGPIMSQGMLDVSISDAESGEEYSFQGSGLSFVVTLPVTGDPALAPDTIDMWWYDESTGLWMKDGTADKTPIDGADFYVGNVTHFSTWNMDFKTPDVVRIHGTINDVEHDMYDITIEGPGFLRQFTMTDRDMEIINMLRNIMVELTIVKRSTGFTNVFVFETRPTSGDVVELGDLLGDDFLSFVWGLKVYQDGAANVTFTWNDPDNVNFTGLRIEYDSTSIVIGEGVETHTISGLTPGTIEFSLTALYGSETSTTVIRRVRLGDYAELSIQLNIDSELENAILQNYASVEDWYNLYYSFGANTGYLEYTGPVTLPVQTVELLIEIDDYELEYVYDGNPYTWYVNTPNWYRDDDNQRYYGADIDIDLDSDGDGDDLFTVNFYGIE